MCPLDLFARRRAEDLRLTRGVCNVPAPEHFLWLHERLTLPDDELEPLGRRRRMPGAMLAGEASETALLLLDSHHLDTPEIEALLQVKAIAEERAEQPASLREASPDQPQPNFATSLPIPNTQRGPQAARSAPRISAPSPTHRMSRRARDHGKTPTATFPVHWDSLGQDHQHGRKTTGPCPGRQTGGTHPRASRRTR